LVSDPSVIGQRIAALAKIDYVIFDMEQKTPFVPATGADVIFSPSLVVNGIYLAMPRVMVPVARAWQSDVRLGVREFCNGIEARIEKIRLGEQTAAR
jgi:hypothetical protein